MIPNAPISRQVRRASAAAFTLAELLTVIAIIVVLAGILLPALARPRFNTQAVTCLGNLQQLAQAWQLYAADYASYVPPNPDDAGTSPDHAWVEGFASIGAAQEFNPDILADPKQSMLAPYLGGGTTVFHCPQDLRAGRYQGTNAALQGRTVPVARSYSMNLAVGTNPNLPGGKQPTDGAWLDGSYGHRANKTWFTFARTTDMRNPGPAQTFVFLDENPNSINDGVFALVGPYPGRQQYLMIDFPASYHNGGGDFGFADGHAEVHHWADSRTKPIGPVFNPAQPGNVDIVWMSSHATALVRQPQFTAAGPVSSNTFQITLPALSGASYVFEYKDSLSATGWTSLPAISATNTGPFQFLDPTATNGQRFYRAWTR